MALPAARKKTRSLIGAFQTREPCPMRLSRNGLCSPADIGVYSWPPRPQSRRTPLVISIDLCWKLGRRQSTRANCISCFEAKLGIRGTRACRCVHCTLVDRACLRNSMLLARKANHGTRCPACFPGKLCVYIANTRPLDWTRYVICVGRERGNADSAFGHASQSLPASET